MTKTNSSNPPKIPLDIPLGSAVADIGMDDTTRWYRIASHVWTRQHYKIKQSSGPDLETHMYWKAF